MVGMGSGIGILFNLDMDGHQGQRHTKSTNGIDVPTFGNSWCLQLVGINYPSKKSIKSMVIARSTLVDAFGKCVIIVV